MFGYGAARTRDNPFESTINETNVPTLVTRWVADTSGAVTSSPAIARGVAYVGSDKLYAFDAVTGATLWTAKTNGFVPSSPAIVGGTVYVGSDDGNLYAFDAAGSGTCSGTPKVCSPLWTAPTGSFVESSPTVVNGVVYVGADDGNLYAFDAAGGVGCSGSPKTCTALWTAPTGNRVSSSPAVANGVVYVGSFDDKLYAFDATGNIGCGGTPKTCGPLWTAQTGGFVESSPAVANGVVYVGSDDNNVYAFDAAGSVGCSGSPKTCVALWTGATGGPVTSSPAVANGVVYVGSWDTRLYAFDARGSRDCSGTPKTCAPLWTAPTGNTITSSPAVANEVVYIGSGDDRLFAFDAGGFDACSGTPAVCASRWSASTGAGVSSSPAVVNGLVYVGSEDGRLYAFGLPKIFVESRLGHLPLRAVTGETRAFGDDCLSRSGEGVATGGGFESDGDPVPVTISESEPTTGSPPPGDTAWVVTLTNTGADTFFRAQVLCVLPGAANIHVMQRTAATGTTLTPGASRSSTATCEGGEVAVGGGYVATHTSDGSISGAVVAGRNEAAPDDAQNPTAWTVFATNNDTGNIVLDASVTCATFSGPVSADVAQRGPSTSVTLAPGASDSSTARCQIGEVATAGGYVARRSGSGSLDHAIALEQSEATLGTRVGPSDWTVTVTNNDSVPVNVAARVMCVS